MRWLLEARLEEPSLTRILVSGNRPSPAHRSDILFSFHFGFSGSPAALENLRWRRAVPGQRPTTRSGPEHVATWYRRAIKTLRTIAAEARPFDGDVDAMGASSAERGGSAQAYGRSAEIALGKRRNGSEEGPSKRQRRPRCYRYGVHTDNGPIALQAFWGMHVEAMNFSGMGHAEYATALDLSPHSLRIWRDRLEQSGNEMDWRSLLHPSARAQLSSAANCARRKCRLHVSGGRPVKPASLQRRAKAGDDAGDREAWRCGGGGLPPPWHRHQPALPLARPVRSDRSKNAATGDSGARRRRGELGVGLAVLRVLVGPPDGMTTIELEDGRRVFAPAGSSLVERKRQLAGKEKAS